MKRVVASIFSSLILAACASSLPPAQQVADLAKRVGDAVWKVEAHGCGWLSHGSAFAIGDRLLVTNRHVVANDSSPTLRSRTGETLKGKVIGSSATPDVAIIEVSESLPLTLDWASTDSLARREPLIVIGYPSPKHTFAASAGQIVSFQGSDGAREAALANAPIEKGNSGGPAVRADTSVAGVVTLMSVRDSSERVAVFYTADAVRPSVDRFIAKPTKVLSTCGLGPNYVPEVPNRFDIDEAPPTPEPDVPLVVPTPTVRRTVPPAQLRTAPPPQVSVAPPVTEKPAPTRPCPTGRINTHVGRVSSSPDESQPGWWNVEVNGTITNDSSASASFDRVHVDIKGTSVTRATGVADRTTLEPGGSTTWKANAHVQSSEAPSEASATTPWRWSDPDFDRCV